MKESVEEVVGEGCSWRACSIAVRTPWFVGACTACNVSALCLQKMSVY